jgi:choline monooxygenase
MFVHQHSLRYLLRPEHYVSAQHFALEIDRLFRPNWQFLCARTELARDGDFLTVDLFDRPVLVRNCGGRIQAFENICSHRHSLLTDEARGNAPTLRCRYHGWEYDDDGCTAKIPDARCFRPWDRDNSRLNLFPTEQCGDLVFARMTPDGDSLRDWMGPFFEEMAEAFAPEMWKMKSVWEFDCHCNWKVPVENTLESYHLPTVHSVTFGGFLPHEEDTEHLLSDRFTALTYAVSPDSWIEQLQARVSNWLGRRSTHRYRHCHLHPNTILVSTDTFNYALMYLPISPTAVRVRIRMFALYGPRSTPLTRMLAWSAFQIGLARTRRIMTEDINLYAAQQKGLVRSRHPGVLGSREERLYVFHKYILDSLGISYPSQSEKSSELPQTKSSDPV